MVRQFLKKRSKRVSCKTRYKIEKKVREHKRKLKKESKRNPNKSKSKDPGIPNSLPFRSKIIQDLRANREKELEQMKMRQEESRQNLLMEKRKLTDMVEQASKKNEEFEVKKLNTEKNAVEEKMENRDTSLKTFYKEFKKVVDAADVILEVLDARDPLGSRCPQVEEAVLNSGSKRLVLVLNKIDLIPLENLQEWLTYLRKEFPTVPFKASTQQQQTNLSRKKFNIKSVDPTLTKTNRCLGAEILMKVLANYCRNKDIKTTITVGVVGFPNVGKSSIINSLKRSKSCLVGSVPGVTKKMQQIHLDKHIVLLDSPGIVMAKNASDSVVALKNAMKVESLEDPIKPVEAILQRASKNHLMLFYCISDYSVPDEFLGLLAKKKGRIKRGGVPDREAAARILLHDWNTGRIKYFTHPPETEQSITHISAELVQTMAKEFDISSFHKEEEEVLQDGHYTKSSVAMAIESTGPTEGTSELINEEMEKDDNNDTKSILSEKIVIDTISNRNKSGESEGIRKRREKKIDKVFKNVMEEEGNLKLNQNMKKTYKAVLKKRKRNDKVSDSLSESLSSAINLNSGEDYDFEVDFN